MSPPPDLSTLSSTELRDLVIALVTRVRGPEFSPPEADPNRHLRPEFSPPVAGGSEA